MPKRLIAIVEDEDKIRGELASFLTTYFKKHNLDWELVKFSNAYDFLENYNHQYSVIFMDINMPQMNGLEAVKKLREMDSKVTVIFVTGLAQFAIEGYKVNAFDYILKPFNYDTLSLTLNRLANSMMDLDEKFITISNNSQYSRRLNISTIEYIEVDNHKLSFHTIDGVITAPGSMKKIAKELVDHSFAFCSISYLVNLAYVTGVTKTQVFVGKDTLYFSRPKKKEFIEKLNEYLGKGGGSHGS